MTFIKDSIRKAVRSFGYEIANRRTGGIGFHKYADISNLLSSVASPVVFDVGANIGQTVKTFKGLLPSCHIHSFEPSANCFKELEKQAALYANVSANNVALGRAAGQQKFFENTSTVMNSFLELGEDGWGEIVHETQVRVTTLDEYCAANKIPRIDFLKIDTQGYDMEVLGGSGRMIKEGAIRLVYVEMAFAKLYKNAPAFDQIYRFFIEHGFRLVALYDLRYKNNLISECDGLFGNSDAIAIIGAEVRGNS